MGKAWLQLKDTEGNRRTYSVVVPVNMTVAAQALAAATGALTAAIRLAGSAQAQSAAAGALSGAIGLAVGSQGRAWLQVKDGAGNRRTYSVVVTHAGAQAVATATGALTTVPRLAGNAVDVVTANGALTNWQTVTLAEPLYTGVGSILDSNFWVGAPPVAGNVIAYDGTYMTILPSGEIEATSNSFTALAQYNNGSGWQIGTVTVLPTSMVAFAGAQASASGSLTGGSVGLAAAAVDVASAAGALVTAILLRSNATAQAQASGAITALIKLMSGAAAQSSASGSLAGVPIALAADASSEAGASGSVTAQIRLAAEAVVSAAASAGLLTGVTVAGDARANATAYANLMAQINFQADAQAESTANLSLTALGPVVISPHGTSSFARSRRPRVLH